MPKNKSVRVIFDTNIWVSFLISNKLIALDSLIFSGNFTILLSAELLMELEATLSKPKLKRYFHKSVLADLVDAFDAYIEFIQVTSKLEICRDPKDDFLIELAFDGKADFIVTGDKDLLTVNKYGNTEMINFSDFKIKMQHLKLN